VNFDRFPELRRRYGNGIFWGITATIVAVPRLHRNRKL